MKEFSREIISVLLPSLSVPSHFPEHVGKRDFLQFTLKRFSGTIRNPCHDPVDIFPDRAFPGRFIGMRTEHRALFHGAANLTQRYFVRFAQQYRSAARTARGGDEACILEFDKNTPDHHWIGIDGFSEPGRGIAMILFQAQYSHHVHREGKPAIMHTLEM